MFGPLPKQYCVYFYAITVICFVVFAVTMMGSMYTIFKHYKTLNRFYYVNTGLLLMNLFFAYFANRLFNTMCIA